MKKKKKQPRSTPNGLTHEEGKVMSHLVNAWNSFVNLPTRMHDETEEFRSAIHAAQALIATRVACRVEPSYWSWSTHSTRDPVE